MNEVRNRKERTERKRPRAGIRDISRAAMVKSPSTLVVETPVKRPSRACSSRQRLVNVSDDGAGFLLSPTPTLPRTSLNVSNDYSLLVEQPSSRPSASRSGIRAVSLTLASSVSKERLQLRSLWEMAGVMNFFCVFRYIINNLPEFTMDELESAILTPNSVLDTIHVVLLKGVPPAARVPLRSDTWPTVLSKKFKDWWWRVAEGPCPLMPCQGAERAAYLELDAPTRVRVLLALCEMRVDQDDARLYIDDSVKRCQLPVVIRKDRSGCGAEGTTFWLEEDLLMGQRLYREGQATTPAPPSKNKGRGWGRGRNVPPPVPGSWETVATNFEEFQEVSTRLLESRNRLEAAMGKKLMQSLMPQLEEIQKKKDRMVKKQQREAVLLDNMLQGNGLAAGRSRRERKPVTYTFDEFDRSISEAIKLTKRNMSETSFRHGYNNGVNDVAGFGRERIDSSPYEQVRHGNGGRVGVRRSSRNFRLHPGSEFGEESEAGDASLERHLVEAELGFTDDEIEGEAVYDDDYLAARQLKGSYSLERGEGLREYIRGDANFDRDGEAKKGGKMSDDNGGNLNGNDIDGLMNEEILRKKLRRGPKLRLVNDISCEGARRNARVMFEQTGGTDEELSDFDEQIVRDAQQRLRRAEGGRSESSALGLGSNQRDAADFELEEASDSHEASGYSSVIRSRTGGGFVERKRNSWGVPSIGDDAESTDHSGELMVQRSARLKEDDDHQEADSVDLDGEGIAGQEPENREGARRRRQLLDLNEIATAAQGHTPMSENEESEYTEDELEHGTGAG